MRGDFDEDEFDDDEIMPFECGLSPRGGCGLAGTEECEFECPYRLTERKQAEAHPWTRAARKGA